MTNKKVIIYEISTGKTYHAIRTLEDWYTADQIQDLMCGLDVEIEDEIISIDEPMYAIHQYSSSGKHIKSHYTRALEDAIEIRNEIIRSSGIAKKPWFFPTIWKEDGNTFTRVTGF